MLTDEYVNGTRNCFLLGKTEIIRNNIFNTLITYFWFSGDSGYAQQPWLFVPLPEPQTRAEKNYCKTHRRIRNMVERCIGVLKSRFRCLCRQRILMYSAERAGDIIVACVVLHNFMVRSKYPEPPEREIIWNIEWERRNNDLADQGLEMNANNIRDLGVAARDRLIRQYF